MDAGELRETIAGLAARIAAPDHLLPTFGRSDQTGRPHVEVDAGGGSYVVCERGLELERHRARDRDELLFWVFRDVTFSMAVDHEVANRVAGEDFRRLLYRTQVALLAEVEPRWAHRYVADRRERFEAVGLDPDTLLDD